MIFYDGIAHKIDDVEFVIPEDDGPVDKVKKKYLLYGKIYVIILP